jgi:hypothetical protein
MTVQYRKLEVSEKAMASKLTDVSNPTRRSPYFALCTHTVHSEEELNIFLHCRRVPYRDLSTGSKTDNDTNEKSLLRRSDACAGPP